MGVAVISFHLRLSDFQACAIHSLVLQQKSRTTQETKAEKSKHPFASLLLILNVCDGSPWSFYLVVDS